MGILISGCLKKHLNRSAPKEHRVGKVPYARMDSEAGVSARTFVDLKRKTGPSPTGTTGETPIRWQAEEGDGNRVALPEKTPNLPGRDPCRCF